MQMVNWPGNNYWPLWQRIIFRFVCIYFLLYTAPWTWIELIPGLDAVTVYYYQLLDWLVNGANKYIFHTYRELVPTNGSGDTSYAWTMLKLFLLVALAGCIIWSLAGRKKTQYNRLAWWFKIILRYYIILSCFNYGFIKLFHMQMPFPGNSLMATQLGDLLPMRLSWIYMGYSGQYQFFAGAMEVLAGCLLLFRRTSTAGTLLAAGVFANVALMNTSYDIPVKLFSQHLFIACLVLLAFEYKRLFSFFINRVTPAGNMYSVTFPAKWMRVTGIVLKLVFIAFVVVLGFYNLYSESNASKSAGATAPFQKGIYDVTLFVKNGDTIPALVTDTLRWKDVAIDDARGGSVNTTDTIFWQRYRRGYFKYKVNDSTHTVTFSRSSWQMDMTELFTLDYKVLDTGSIMLSGKMRNDAVTAVLKKSNRHFQLEEKQFHWLSEYNR